MGRVEKKFQKKKDRERAVRKKILLKRAVSRAQDKEAKKRHLLEKAVDKKTHQPIRKHSPELQKALEAVNTLTDDAFKEKDLDVDSSDDNPAATVRGKSKWIDSTEVTGFAPDICNTTCK